jgi:integrase
MTKEFKVKMKYLDGFFDKLGRRRWRLRRKGHKNVELPVNGDVNSPEFLACYFAALRGQRPSEAVAAIPINGKTGMVATAITEFLNSTTFKADADTTQALRRPKLESVSRLVGHLPLAQMDDGWIRRWLERSSTPSAKRTRFLALKAFTRWALDRKMIATDPCAAIKVKVATAGDGHHTWTDQQIEKYRAHFPIGTRARLALELLLAMAARRGDGIRMGRRHFVVNEDGEICLRFVQQKNRKRKPMTVQIPVPSELAAAIEACPSPPESLTFLVNEWGRPFSEKAFNSAFRKWCDEAGLPECCTPHGLRKGKSRIMAESNCTAPQMMGVTGHRSLKEVQKYIDKFNRETAAAEAQKKVAERARKMAAANNVVPLKIAAER